MVGLDLGTRLIKVNMTKVRKDETIPPGKPGIDLLLPDEKESLQKEQGCSSTDSKKKGSSIPTPKAATAPSGSETTPIDQHENPGNVDSIHSATPNKALPQPEVTFSRATTPTDAVIQE